jgi:hypothetical protein
VWGDEAESAPEFALNAASEDAFEVVEVLVGEVEAFLEEGPHETKQEVVLRAEAIGDAAVCGCVEQDCCGDKDDFVLTELLSS